MAVDITSPWCLFARANVGGAWGAADAFNGEGSMKEPSAVEAPTFDPAALRDRVVRNRHGFVTKAEVELMAQHATARLWPLLVRCGGCRFVCAAQDVAVLIAAIEGRGDYVRDVSFPVEGSR